MTFEWQKACSVSVLGSAVKFTETCTLAISYFTNTLYFCISHRWHTQEFFFFWGGVQQIHLRTERTGIWGCSPLVRGSGGSCNLVQEISYIKIFLIFGTLRLFMITTNLLIIANVKQLQT